MIHNLSLAAVALLLSSTAASAQCSLQRLAALHPNECEQFGKSVSLDGNILAVGAHAATDDPVLPCATGPGGVYVFERVGLSWLERQRLAPADGTTGDEFGNIVSVSGNRIVVGAEQHGTAAGSKAGAAYVYELQAGVWNEVAKLAPDDAVGGHYFARSVSISGDTIMCGTRFDKDLGNQAGAAYIFQRLETGEWVQEAKVHAGDGETKDLFGNAVAIDGTTAVSGAYFKEGSSGNKAGAAYVYERVGSAWVETAKLEASDQEGGAEFGRYVAVEGDRILVGARSHGGPGAAYVYERSGGSWVETAKLTPDDGDTGDQFGETVALDGNRAIVGARNYDPPLAAGAAYVFELQGGSWNQIAKLTSPTPAVGAKLGHGVAMRGNVVVAGAPYDLHNYGSASVYSLGGPCGGTPYGAVNPPGSLVLISGGATVGSAIELGLDNPLGTQNPGALPVLLVALAPAPGFPSGLLVPGFGMEGVGAIGELLIAAPAVDPILGPAWSGAGTPASITIPIPGEPVVEGLSFYVQGLLYDPTPGAPALGFTGAYGFTIAP